MSESKCLSLRKAIDLLRLPGNRMMKMHTQNGVAYFVLPYGRLSDDDANTILARQDLIAFEDGLFPGNSQGWRLG